MKTTLRVLIVEDSESDALLVLRHLSQAGFEPEHVRVETAEDFIAALTNASWDIIIADYTMPKFSGLDAFHRLTEMNLDIPFIIVSGSIGEETAVVAMKAGVQDYVMKGNLSRLAPAVQRELREAEGRRARRQAEEQLRMSERLRTVGELAASLIHDIKNPLHVVQIAAEALNTDNLPGDKREKYFGMIEQQVQRIVTMSQEIMEFVRGNMQLSLNTVNLGELVRELVDTYALPFGESGIDLSCANLSSSPEPKIVADREKLWRALLNLITNAKEATPEGGQILLSAALQEKQAVIKVTDTGTGIPGHLRETLFKPFVTYNKSRGTGLGLAIVKRIVDAHEGDISFHSAETGGTTFLITLPKDGPQKSAPSSASAQKTILT